MILRKVSTEIDEQKKKLLLTCNIIVDVIFFLFLYILPRRELDEEGALLFLVFNCEFSIKFKFNICVIRIQKKKSAAAVCLLMLLHIVTAHVEQQLVLHSDIHTKVLFFRQFTKKKKNQAKRFGKTKENSRIHFHFPAFQ